MNHPAFKAAKRISVYLSTEAEVSTIEVLREMFRQQKQVFVPTYNKGTMEMVKLRDYADYESLPLTKWNIKQPSVENRENAIDSGLLLLLMGRATKIMLPP